jgi:hypothetical protein
LPLNRVSQLTMRLHRAAKKYILNVVGGGLESLGGMDLRAPKGAPMI